MHKGVGQQQTTTNQQKTAQYNKTQTEMTCKTYTRTICQRRKRDVLIWLLSIYKVVGSAYRGVVLLFLLRQ